MKSLSHLLVAGALVCSSSAVSAANILVFGDYTSSRSAVAAELAAQGNTVTEQLGLAADLTTFDTIWQVAAFTSLSAPDQANLSSFLAAGKGIYLTGERPCCETLNTSVGQLINSNLKVGAVTVGGFGDVGPPYSYNPNAIGNIDADLATGWVPGSPGQLTGASGNNVVVTADLTGRTVAAAWGDNDLVNGGRIALFMDVNWLDGIDSNEKLVVANIQEFLFDGFVGPTPSEVPLPAAGWLLIAGVGALGAMRKRKKA